MRSPTSTQSIRRRCAGRTSPCRRPTSTRPSPGTSGSPRSSCSTAAKTPTATAPGSAIRDQVDKPFILVLVSFKRDMDKGPQPIMAPFAHIGIEVTSRAEVDAIAASGGRGGLPGLAAHRDAAAHRLHLRADRSRRQHDRVLLRPGRVRDGAGGLGYAARDDRRQPGSPAAVCVGYLEAFATGDADAVAAFVTDDFVNEHTAALGSGCVGIDEYRQRLPGFLASMPGLRYDIEDVMADGDRVVRGVHAAYDRQRSRRSPCAA